MCDASSVREWRRLAKLYSSAIGLTNLRLGFELGNLIVLLGSCIQRTATGTRRFGPSMNDEWMLRSETRSPGTLELGPSIGSHPSLHCIWTFRNHLGRRSCCIRCISTMGDNGAASMNPEGGDAFQSNEGGSSIRSTKSERPNVETKRSRTPTDIVAQHRMVWDLSSRKWQGDANSCFVRRVYCPMTGPACVRRDHHARGTS